jgi:hypothetical protein
MPSNFAARTPGVQPDNDRRLTVEHGCAGSDDLPRFPVAGDRERREVKTARKLNADLDQGAHDNSRSSPFIHDLPAIGDSEAKRRLPMKAQPFELQVTPDELEKWAPKDPVISGHGHSGKWG